jgi:hypothetical protein
LDLNVSGRVAKEPQTIVVSARMKDGELRCGYLWVCQMQLCNDYVNVPHTFSCGLTPELSRPAKRVRLE